MGVKIRGKRGKLYLDIYQNGTRKWEALGLTITEDKRQNKLVRRQAEISRSMRELQLHARNWDIQDPVAGKTNLVSYLEKTAKHYSVPNSARAVSSCSSCEKI